MDSIIQQRGSVKFPSFIGERIYMREFKKADGLPKDLIRWQETVDSMLDGVDTEDSIFLMVDQALVRGGDMHRRGGVHVDGYWIPELQAHGSGSGGHNHKTPEPSGGHGLAQIGHSHVERGHSHRQPSGGHRHSPKSHSHGGSFDEAIILASDVFGCRAYNGPFQEQIGDGGDCSHVDLAKMDSVDFEPGRIYAGHTLSMLHESVPIIVDSMRTVVRLNVRGWHP